MNKLRKIFFPTLLVISFLLLIWTFYKAQIIFKGEENTYYIAYYIVSIILIFLSILTFFLNKEIKEQLIISIVVVVSTLYLFEGYLGFNKYKLSILTGKSNLEVYEDLIEKKKNVSLAIYPTSHLDQKEIFPLSGISNSQTVFCAENGYHAVYESDRYGFNNPDSEWDKNEIDYMLIGDSYTHGACVNRPDDIGSVLRTLSNKSVLNLGMYNNSSLIEYATIREYLNPNVKNVIWIYFGNDIGDLMWELEDKFLGNYLNDTTFTQNLKSRQGEVDVFLNKWINARLPTERKKLQSKKIREKQKDMKLLFFLTNFFKLAMIRDYAFTLSQRNAFLEQMELESNKAKKGFEEILKLAKDLAAKNNSNFYVAYLPGYIHYTNLNFNTHYEFVKKTTNKLDIPLIDLHEEFFGKEKDTSIFSTSKGFHYNELGYKKVAETIYKYLE